MSKKTSCHAVLFPIMFKLREISVLFKVRVYLIWLPVTSGEKPGVRSESEEANQQLD